MPALYLRDDDRLSGSSTSWLTGTDYTIFFVANARCAPNSRIFRAFNEPEGEEIAVRCADGGEGAALVHHASDATTVNVDDVPRGEVKLYVAERRSMIEAPELRLRVWSASSPSGQLAGAQGMTPELAEDLILRVGDDFGDETLLGEVIVYTRAMADAEVDAVKSYLLEKWGVLE